MRESSQCLLASETELFGVYETYRYVERSYIAVFLVFLQFRKF